MTAARPMLDALLDELAERLAVKVLAKLAAPVSHYTTRAAGPHPPGKSRAWALRTIKTIPGARKVGRDWIVSVADFEAWLTDLDAARVVGKPRGKPANDAPDVEALAEQGLRAAGFRTRAGR